MQFEHRLDLAEENARYGEKDKEEKSPEKKDNI
jgi:hypothetical protein